MKKNRIIEDCIFPESIPFRDRETISYYETLQKCHKLNEKNSNAWCGHVYASIAGDRLREMNSYGMVVPMSIRSWYSDYPTLNEIDKKQLNNFISDYINVKVVPIAVRNDILEIMTVFQDIRFWIDLKTLKFTTADQYETAKTVIKNVEDIPGFFEKAQKLIEQRDKNS